MFFIVNVFERISSGVAKTVFFVTYGKEETMSPLSAPTKTGKRWGGRNLALIIPTSIMLALILVTLIASFSRSTTHAATSPKPQGFGSIVPSNPTAQDIAQNSEKQLLAQEYMQVLHGKGSIQLFEQHLMALMQKRGITYSSRLSQVLTTNRKLHPALCPSIVLPCPVYAAQFPEYLGYYCGPAAASTILVEDSFSWGSQILTNGSDHLVYDAYRITQPSGDYTPDENLLAQSKYTGAVGGQTSFGTVQATLNAFVGGKGGWYNPVMGANVPGSFQNDLVTDLNTGWDIAGGLHITGKATDATLTGYLPGVEFWHWIPITGYGNSGATTYYNDPIYRSTDKNLQYWTGVPGPVASTSTSNMIAILERMGFIW